MEAVQEAARPEGGTVVIFVQSVRTQALTVYSADVQPLTSGVGEDETIRGQQQTRRVRPRDTPLFFRPPKPEKDVEISLIVKTSQARERLF